MSVRRFVAGGVLWLLVGCAPSGDVGAELADVAASVPRGTGSSSATMASGAAPSPTAEHRPAIADAGARPADSSEAAAVAPPVADPIKVEIPTIGVAAPLIDLGLNADRTLEVPTDVDVAGWYTGRSRPGAVGPAVIAGHVDSRDAPAVFYHLRELARGDDVLVHREDGSTARFTVNRVEQHAKDDFPTHAVYGPTAAPTLRLITCGGSFDRARSSYNDNIVVFATLAVPQR